MNGRFPDFLIIGAMKAGTTTVFRWLDMHPGTALPKVKEPAFFAHDYQWDRGLDWYKSLFPGTDDNVTGEASVIYTHPRFTDAAAARIASVLPEVKIVFVARDPIKRARSHYVHQVQRGRETRTWAEASNDPANPYLARSRYWACLSPYVSRIQKKRIHTVWFEEVFSEDESEWLRLLDFLGLAPHPRPVQQFNQSSEFLAVPSALRQVAKSVVPRVFPASIRRMAKARLIRSRDDVGRLIDSSREEVEVASDDLWGDVDSFLAWAGSPGRWIERD